MKDREVICPSSNNGNALNLYKTYDKTDNSKVYKLASDEINFLNKSYDFRLKKQVIKV